MHVKTGFEQQLKTEILRVLTQNYAVLEHFCARVIDCFDMLLERTAVALKSETDCNFYAAAVNEANVIPNICISTHAMTGLMTDSSELLFVYGH